MKLPWKVNPTLWEILESKLEINKTNKLHAASAAG